MFCVFQSTGISAAETSVIGWVEDVKVYNNNIQLKAKIDTGADNSSLHAENIELFEHEGEDWMRFDLNDISGKLHRLDAQVMRYTKINDGV